MTRRRAMSIKAKKTFSRTAVKTKKININPNISRGGIRL